MATDQLDSIRLSLSGILHPGTVPCDHGRTVYGTPVCFSHIQRIRLGLAEAMGQSDFVSRCHHGATLDRGIQLFGARLAVHLWSG